MDSEFQKILSTKISVKFLILIDFFKIKEIHLRNCIKYSYNMKIKLNKNINKLKIYNYYLNLNKIDQLVKYLLADIL